MKFINIFILFLSLILVKSLSAQIKIMPLGASITMGYGSSDENGYRLELRNLLVYSGYDVDFVGSLENGTFEDQQHEGHGGYNINQVKNNVYNYLNNNPAQIILVHIGTNNITDTNSYTTPDEIAALLDEIDRWENDNAPVIVVLPEIINRNCITDVTPCDASKWTTEFNDNVVGMAEARIASGDRLIIVDLENGAGLNYRLYPGGDMIDNKHPYDNGYAKMADTWFVDGLLKILPQADAGADQSVDEKTLVTLDGSGSCDPDDTAITYMWEQMPTGTPLTLSHPTSKKPTFTAPAVGSGGERLEFRLTVTDTDGFQNSSTVYIDTNNVLIPPVADAGPDQNVKEGKSVTLNGSGSDSDGNIVSVQWEQVAGKNQVNLTTPNDWTTEFTAPDVDSNGDVLEFKLTVEDDDGLVGSDTVTISVNLMEAPLADAGADQSVTEGKTVTLNGSGSDSDGNIVSVQWEQIAGKNMVDLTTPNDWTTEFTAPDVDSNGDVLEFKLTVEDDDGLVGEDIVYVTNTSVAVSAGTNNGGGSGGCFIQSAAE